MILIIGFCVELGSVSTAIGLAFVYGGALIGKAKSAMTLAHLIPRPGGLVITVLGLVIGYQALQRAGINPSDFWHVELDQAKSFSALATLGLGFVIGLRHALDTDHLAAVSTIVSERKHWLSSLLIGGLWGIGHTVSLLIAGIAVVFMNLNIEKYEKPLEFCVALMLIGLGMNVLIKLARGGKIHFHEHEHGRHRHNHPHIHDDNPEPEPHTHHGVKLGIRPLVIGMIHGLAGSAGLLLVLLATIKSTALAFGVIAIFGIGSIGGMMLMSLVLSLPLHLTANSFSRTNVTVHALAGVFSLGFGLLMAYELGHELF
ncbi:MAG: urease accessory protein UreH [Acidobacteria bacterium]|nr:urease accessory protein UreH [Acidobacteriota bacterium]